MWLPLWSAMHKLITRSYTVYGSSERVHALYEWPMQCLICKPYRLIITQSPSHLAHTKVSTILFFFNISGLSSLKHSFLTPTHKSNISWPKFLSAQWRHTDVGTAARPLLTMNWSHNKCRCPEEMLRVFLLCPCTLILLWLMELPYSRRPPERRWPIGGRIYAQTPSRGRLNRHHPSTTARRPPTTRRPSPTPPPATARSSAWTPAPATNRKTTTTCGVTFYCKCTFLLNFKCQMSQSTRWFTCKVPHDYQNITY